MIWFALVLAANSLTLFDEIVRVPRGQWRGLNVSLHQRPATVRCRFLLVSGGSGVRVALMSREDVERFREGRGHRVLAASGYVRKGELSHLVARPGDYMVLLDNRMEGRGAATVELKVEVVFTEHRTFEARTVPAVRRRAVVAISLAVFCLISAWSGWRLWAAVKARGQTS